MTEEKLDVSKSTAQVLVEGQDTDNRAMTEWQLAGLEVQLKRYAARQTDKNFHRQPWLFGVALIFVVALYALLVAEIVVVGLSVFLVDPRIAVAAFFVTAAVPTILVIALLKATFSQRSESATKISDAVPVKKIIDAAGSISE